MAVLRTPDATRAYGNRSPVHARARSGSRHRAPIGAHTRMLVRRALALFVYSMSYPLLAAALWTGARDRAWGVSSALVALGGLTSFFAWGMLHAVYPECTGDAPAERESLPSADRPAAMTTYLALYHRIGAIVVLLGSYAVNARLQGWPAPESFIGWFALVWVPLFIAVAFPVACVSRPIDPRE
jgi:hypothetical protein